MKERRFAFGKNWSHFLSVLNEERITEAEKSLVTMLNCPSLLGKTFLDVGSGSGLFSLAARRLGASVHSFDYDADSVMCTGELKRRYFPNDDAWTIEQGSVLDLNYVTSLRPADIVYSWGVLHHTGDLKKAMHHVQLPVKNEGLLFVAIYNDNGFKSLVWKQIKKFYSSSIMGKLLVSCTLIPFNYVLRGLAADLFRFRNPLRRYIDYRKQRGMSMFHDWIDWIGGYPFETARADEIIEFYRSCHFHLLKFTPALGSDNNQFVFQKQ